MNNHKAKFSYEELKDEIVSILDRIGFDDIAETYNRLTEIDGCGASKVSAVYPDNYSDKPFFVEQ